MSNHTDSSHLNHVGVAVLVFLLGALVGYGVGGAYESANQADMTYDSDSNSVIGALKMKYRKANDAMMKKTTTSTTEPATTTTTP